MSRAEFISTFLFSLLFGFSSFSLGTLLTRLFSKIFKEKSTSLNSETFGAAILIGLGILSYAALIIGVLGKFNKTSILVLLIFSSFFRLQYITRIYKSLLQFMANLFRSFFKNIVPISAILLTLGILSTLYLSAMQPPYGTDELHYHFPQVREIVQTQKIDLSFGGHPFYGNIPKTMEIIFAMGTSVDSYSLAHALNFLIMLGFLLIIFGIVRKHVSLTAASISVLLIVFFDDFTWNATVGFIDSATTAMEIGALLFFFDWVISKTKSGLPISATLLGVGLGMKYSPIPTATFIITVLVAIVLKKKGQFIAKVTKGVLPYLIIVFLFCGFWYLKNLILFSNPFYPLYFGHKGISEIEYQSLLDSVQEFGPKTPLHFFELTKTYLTTNGIFVFLSIYLAPLILLIRKKNKFNLIVFIYFVLYTLYWFFVATHQIRFFMPGLVASTILFGIILSEIRIKHLSYIVGGIFIFSLIYSKTISRIDYKSVWYGFWNTKFHLVERQYGLGNITQTEFLRRQFGCQYLIIKYLEDNNLKGNVIDNWSVWFAPSVSFYAQRNEFQTFSFDMSGPSSKLFDALKKGDLRYIYFDSKVKTAFLKSEDPLVVQSKNLKLPTEEFLLKLSLPIFSYETCSLYQIKF